MSETFLQFCAAAQTELTDILSGGITQLNDTARKAPASWHPNGFVVFDLGRHPLGALRMHIWPIGHRQLRDNNPHVHTHSWDLCSRVLSGVYRERMYETCADTNGDEYRAAVIDYARDRNTLEESGAAFLRTSSVITVGAGEVHTVEAGIPHETLIPEDSYAATLLLTSELRLQRSWVYSRTSLPSPQHARPSVNDSLRKRLLRDLEARVKDSR